MEYYVHIPADGTHKTRVGIHHRTDLTGHPWWSHDVLIDGLFKVHIADSKPVSNQRTSLVHNHCVKTYHRHVVIL